MNTYFYCTLCIQISLNVPCDFESEAKILNLESNKTVNSRCSFRDYEKSLQTHCWKIYIYYIHMYKLLKINFKRNFEISEFIFGMK